MIEGILSIRELMRESGHATYALKLVLMTSLLSIEMIIRQLVEAGRLNQSGKHVVAESVM